MQVIWVLPAPPASTSVYLLCPQALPQAALGPPSQAGANVGMSELWLRTPARWISPHPMRVLGFTFTGLQEMFLSVSRSTFHLDSGRTEAPARTELPQASQGRAACSGILHRTPLTLHKRKHPQTLAQWAGKARLAPSHLWAGITAIRHSTHNVNMLTSICFIYFKRQRGHLAPSSSLPDA